MVAMKQAVIDPAICSDAAAKENKFAGRFACNSDKDRGLSFPRVLQYMIWQPNMYMGYVSGCLQGTKAFPFDDD